MGEPPCQSIDVMLDRLTSLCAQASRDRHPQQPAPAVAAHDHGHNVGRTTPCAVPSAPMKACRPLSRSTMRSTK